MSVVEKIVKKISETIIDNTSKENSPSYTLSSGIDSNNINLKILTKDNNYLFVLYLINKENNKKVDVERLKSLYTPFYIEDEEVCVWITDITIEGYESKNYDEVTVSDLKLLLKTLAQNHSRSINEDKCQSLGQMSRRKDFLILDGHFKNFLHKFIENEHCDIDPNMFIEAIDKLEGTSKKLFKTNENVYVNGSVLQTKIYFKYNNDQAKVKLLNGLGKELPLVEVVLQTIFCYTNQKTRQRCFRELVQYYFTELKENLRNLNIDISECLPLEKYERQLLTLTPYVKLEILKYYYDSIRRHMQQDILTSKEDNSEVIDMAIENNKYKKLIKDLLFEVNECVQYPNFTREDCYEVVKNKIKSSEYELLYFKLIPVQEREGFLGDYFKLKICIKQNNEETLLNLFAKYLPTTSDFMREFAINCFEKEEFYYLTLYPKLIEFGLKDILNFLPNCYFARLKEFIIFEDLSVLGYSTCKVSELFTYEFLRVTLKQLAKIHACSLLYEEIRSEETQTIVRFNTEYGEYVKEIPFQDKEENTLRQFANCGVRTVVEEFLEVFPNIPKKLTMDEFKRKARRSYELFFKKIKKSDQFRNVACHGDFWASNMLFKKDNNNIPIDCTVVDFQLVRYCPPAHDLLYFLYMVTNKETREKYMSELIKEYYKDMTMILKNYGFDFHKIYTYDHFLNSCNYMKSQTICHALLVGQFVFYPEEKRSTLFEDEERAAHIYVEDRKEFVEELRKDSPYTTRIKELVEELYDICESDNM